MSASVTKAVYRYIDLNDLCQKIHQPASSIQLMQVLIHFTICPILVASISVWINNTSCQAVGRAHVVRLAFSLGVVSSNPSSVNIFFRRLTKVALTSVIRLSLIGLIVYAETQPFAWKVCCVEYWCEKARKHMSM